ncbi:methylated-DNA-[protein]-cysteine S-methyltransferase [Arthrobacter sp. yr096]|uniref:methylated-DNA--[protein]-cysteine S-methyltransferase n=1 Tax=Arthrobacter sp. yr096 TaxID=1761750 RepID=UPI0008B8B16F|nr:methylated-DNA--[protein]-cysteine S-methyltransferase [Arthrobacter sp. yr096]SEJ20713.1 methylated-DNA-[protein]-cysteine S-methyltransferase [Arthrobacter sp. yr096]
MTLEASPDHSEVASLLEPLDAGLETALAGLHARLARDAQLVHTLDIAYRIVDSPLGKLLLAATDRGIVRVAFELENHGDVLQLLANTVSPRILQAPARLDDAARQLDEYFAGARREFDLTLDFRLSRGFRLNVLQHLPRIAYGRTESYAEVAVAAGSPNAVRAVGTACATNPLPVIVPCHRVVKSDGSFGGYLGGADAKRALLTLEAAA